MQIQMYYCLTGLSIFCLKCFLALMVLRLIIMNFHFKLLSPFIAVQCRRPQFDPLVRKIPWRREWLPTPVFLPGKFHGQRSLAGLQSMGSQRIEYDWMTNAFTNSFTAVNWPFRGGLMAAKPEVPAYGSEHRVSVTKGTQTHCKTDYFHSGNSPGRMPIHPDHTEVDLAFLRLGCAYLRPKQLPWISNSCLVQ